MVRKNRRCSRNLQLLPYLNTQTHVPNALVRLHIPKITHPPVVHCSEVQTCYINFSVYVFSKKIEFSPKQVEASCARTQIGRGVGILPTQLLTDMPGLNANKIQALTYIYCKKFRILCNSHFQLFIKCNCYHVCFEMLSWKCFLLKCCMIYDVL